LKTVLPVLRILRIMKGNFNAVVNSDMPVLVDFSAEWCGPCKAQAPILKELAGEYGDRLKVIKIDVDKNPTIANRFQVRGVPTLALFKRGQILWRQSGLVDAGSLRNILGPHL
jgi:thioredoxin 1